MKIVTLVENTPGAAGCGYEHGLSFYIETDRHKILMDTGASDLFLENAKKLGIDLAAVDTDLAACENDICIFGVNAVFFNAVDD